LEFFCRLLATFCLFSLSNIKHMKTIKKIGIFISLAFILGFILFAVNQIIAFHANLTTVNVTLAWLVTGFISVTIFLLLLIPFILIARLPKSVTFPDNYEEEAQYHTVLRSRL